MGKNKTRLRLRSEPFTYSKFPDFPPLKNIYTLFLNLKFVPLYPSSPPQMQNADSCGVWAAHNSLLKTPNRDQTIKSVTFRPLCHVWYSNNGVFFGLCRPHSPVWLSHVCFFGKQPFQSCRKSHAMRTHSPTGRSCSTSRRTSVRSRTIT